MKKRVIVAFLTSVVLCMTGCGSDVIVDVVSNNVSETDAGDVQNNANKDVEASEEEKTDKLNKAGLKVIAKDDIKVGVMYIGSSEDESGYTYAHELGIRSMISNIGLKEEQVIRKDNVDDTDTKAIEKAFDELIEEGCNVVFTTSWGYMDLTESYAEKYPDIYFAHGTGYKSNGKNFTNYFGRIYQARYLSGLVAGLKTKSNKIGYVSAMGSDNSECTGGVDAFAIGVEKANPNAQVYVAVTNSWFDPEAEQQAAGALIDMDCDVLAQHVDTTAPQVASENNGTWSIGYNSDMSKETPNATITSVIWNWGAYYTSYVNSIINGDYDGENYYSGMDQSLVGLTSLSDLCAEGTAEIVSEESQKIISGEYNVFDGELKTNEGKTVGKKGETLDDATITGGINWYYHNVAEVDWKK